MSTEQQDVAEQVQQTASPAGAGTASAGFTSLGKCLQQARETAGFSIQQIAGEMHLEVRQIELIERDRFRELGAPVFVKGYLRRYAKLVNVDEALLHGLYEALRDPPVAVDPIPSCMNSVPATRKLLPAWSIWAAAGVFAVVSLGTVINKLASSSTSQEMARTIHVDTTTSRPAKIESASSPLTHLLNHPVQAASGKSMLLASVTPVATANAGEITEDNHDVSMPLAAGHVALTLKFTGDSWVEVYDANKRVIMYEMGHDNSVREVRGLAPLNVVLGSAPQVDMQVNGHNAAIPAKRVMASVARFTVDADGSIN